MTGTAADTNTIRIGLPYSGGTGQNQTFIAGFYGTMLPLTGGLSPVYINSAGQLGTILPISPFTGGSGSVPGPSASNRVVADAMERQPASNKVVQELQQQVREQQQRLRDQESMNAELRARLARLEALLAPAAGRRRPEVNPAA